MRPSLPLALLLALILSAVARADGLSISATRLLLGADGATDSISVTNRGDRPKLIQVEAFVWNGPVDGALEPTREILAVPTVFELGAGERQVVRVAARPSGAVSVERAYRVIIGEVPHAVAADESGLRFALRFNLPAFATPAGAEPAPEWRLRRAADGLRLELANRGTAHLRLEEITLRDGDGRLVHGETSPAYVLAGAVGSWTVPAAAARGTRTFSVEAVSNIGPITTLLALEGD
jgi:fimbrial chaperone protein